MTFTALVASASPTAAGRALQMFKSSNAAQTMPAGGTALTAIANRTLDSGADTGLTGAQIATTAGLTVAGFARGAVPLATLDLVGEGGAGARIERDYFTLVSGSSLYLDPGEILVVSNPNAFDALLTWQLSVDVSYFRRDTI